jgi:hypothetical protein
MTPSYVYAVIDTLDTFFHHMERIEAIYSTAYAAYASHAAHASSVSYASYASYDCKDIAVFASDKGRLTSDIVAKAKAKDIGYAITSETNIDVWIHLPVDWPRFSLKIANPLFVFNNAWKDTLSTTMPTGFTTLLRNNVMQLDYAGKVQCSDMNVGDTLTCGKIIAGNGNTQIDYVGAVVGTNPDAKWSTAGDFACRNMEASRLNVFGHMVIETINTNFWKFWNKSENSAGYGFFDVAGDTAVASISVAGACTAASFTPTSDDRLKEDEVYITGAMDTLKKLKPQLYKKYTTFAPREPDALSTLESGLIAQEIYYDAPELRHIVTLPHDAQPAEHISTSSDPSQDPDYSSWGTEKASVNYNGLIPYLIKAMQEQQLVIDELRAKINAIA